MIRIGIDVGGTNTDAVFMRGNRVEHSVKAVTTEDVTSGVLAAVPVVTKEEARLKRRFDRIIGEIPSAAMVPSGCCFHTRCPLVEAHCRSDDPPVTGDPAVHAVNCHVTRFA